MNGDVYVEAILELEEGAAADDVRAWLADRGLDSLPMSTGLLVTGEPATFEAAFGVDLSTAEAPVRLPIPAELGGAVSSVTIPPLPEPHS